MGKGSLKKVNYHMKGIYDMIFVLYHLQFLIFRRSDSMLKIRKNHELTWRISSMMFMKTNMGNNWIIRFPWITD